MIKNFSLCLLFSLAPLFADTIYIVGLDNLGNPTYWSIETPQVPSSTQLLDIDSNNQGYARSVAFSPNQTVYVVGNVVDDDDASAASFWTVSTAGVSSNLNTITGYSDETEASVNGIAFSPSGIGYFVGKNTTQNASYWTVSSLGIVSAANEIDTGGYPIDVDFNSSGQGYIVGLDGSNNSSYWTISPLGVVTGPITLAGGEAGGPSSAYAISFSPNGTAYIVGNSTAGFACYWTISPLGIASSANVLDGGINSMAKGVAFLADGSGIIVGQTANNVSCYWSIASDGTVSNLTALPNASGNGSSANAVSFSSDGSAYIVGLNNANQAVLWTLPRSSPVTYTILDSEITLANSIAIYYALAPNPPQNLTGKFVRNSFGWTYEYAVVLKWQASDSANIAAYNIYKNGSKVGTTLGDATQFEIHNQKKKTAFFEVKAVDSQGRESSAATLTLKG